MINEVLRKVPFVLSVLEQMIYELNEIIQAVSLPFLTGISTGLCFLFLFSLYSFESCAN